MKSLTDDELEEVTEAYYEGKIDTYLGVFFSEYKTGFVRWVQWGIYKGKKLTYQCLDFWGLIYGSIKWVEGGET